MSEQPTKFETSMQVYIKELMAAGAIDNPFLYGAARKYADEHKALYAKYPDWDNGGAEPSDDETDAVDSILDTAILEMFAGPLAKALAEDLPSMVENAISVNMQDCEIEITQ